MPGSEGHGRLCKGTTLIATHPLHVSFCFHNVCGKDMIEYMTLLKLSDQLTNDSFTQAHLSRNRRGSLGISS